MLAFLLVFVLSIYFISNIYQKWSASPIIIGLNAVATSISDIPFPAVTICNMNQARKSYVRDIEEITINGALLQSLCQLEVDADTEMPANFTGKWSLFRQFLLQVSYRCIDKHVWEFVGAYVLYIGVSTLCGYADALSVRY